MFFTRSINIFSNAFSSIVRAKSSLILRDKVIPEPCYLRSKNVLPSDPHRLFIIEEKSDEKDDEIIQVLLVKSVPSLGRMGDIVKVHRNHFWRHLHLLDLAELPCDERRKQILEAANNENVLIGDSYKIQQRIMNHKLYIPMKSKTKIQLSKDHIFIAFLRDVSLTLIIIFEQGIHVERSSIILPELVIDSSFSDEFIIKIKLDQSHELPIKCRIFLYQRLDKNTCTYPTKNSEFDLIVLDNWLEDIPEEKLVELTKDARAYRYRPLPKSVQLKSLHLA